MVSKWIRELKISWTHKRRISSNSYLWSFSKIWTISSLFGCRCWKETRWPKKQQYFSSSNVINTRDFGYFTFMHLHSLTHTHTHTIFSEAIAHIPTHTLKHAQMLSHAPSQSLKCSSFYNLFAPFVCRWWSLKCNCLLDLTNLIELQSVKLCWTIFDNFANLIN